MRSFIYISLLLSFLSCERVELDLSPPSLIFAELAPSPFADMVCGTVEDSVFHLRSGDILSFEALLTDDQALSQFKIDIHNNFDCHGHGGSSTPGFSVPSIENQTEDWAILETQDVTGQQETINRTLDIPENVTAGRYHMQLQVLDESGNDIPFANFYSLIILNSKDTVPPTISTELPQSSFAASKGSEVRFMGSIEDDISLSEGGNGVLFLSYTDLNSGNTFATDEVFPFDSETSTSFNFDFEYTIPSTIPNGNYTFTIRAQDGVRNIATPINFAASISN